MNFKSLVFATAILFLLNSVSIAKTPPPSDMELTTPDGVAIILKPDSSWVFKSNNQEASENDFTVPLSSGKIIKIAQDHSWSFVKQEIIPESKVFGCDSVTGKGHSINPDVTAATDIAQKQAMQEITTKIKLAFKKIKIDPKKLPDCIKNVQKEVVKKEDFKEKVGWEVSVFITVNKNGLVAMSDCAKKTIDSSKTVKTK